MKKRLSAEEMGELAADAGRQHVLKQCKSVGLTSRLTIKRIREGLNALENKVFYDKDRGKCVTGPNMINWTARQKAVDQSISLLDLKPAEKRKIEFPDENGKPQKIGGIFTDMERATRLVYLLSQAKKRKAECKVQRPKLKK